MVCLFAQKYNYSHYFACLFVTKKKKSLNYNVSLCDAFTFQFISHSFDMEQGLPIKSIIILFSFIFTLILKITIFFPSLT